MPSYLHPGVYIEEIPSGVKSIEAVGTSTAAFIGYTEKGPIGEPTVIYKWDDYVDKFGGLIDQAKDLKGDPMGFSVFSFFQNGGSTAYIVRLTAGTPLKARGAINHPDVVAADKGLGFTAANEGEWANGMVVRIKSKNPPGSALYTLEVLLPDSKGKLTLRESYTDISLDENDPMFIKNVVEDNSQLLETAEIRSLTEFFLGTSTSANLEDVSLDFSAIVADNDRTIKISLDGTADIDVIIEKKLYADLAELALRIQSQVTTGAVAERRTQFTCTADTTTHTLLLTSGSRTVTSSVAVNSASGLGAGALNGLTIAGGAVQKTGQQSLDALLSATEAELSGGANGTNPPQAAAYNSVFTEFVKYRNINIICLPGQYWPSDGSGNAIISSAISHAETMKNRMVIVDTDDTTSVLDEAAVLGYNLPTSTYTALYYPWLQYKNPFYTETTPGYPQTLLVPPSGAAAGMWAKIDGKRGVWKAPAGVETFLLGVAGLKHSIDDSEQDSLNPLGVNCLRTMPGYGRVIWGARTLATKADPEWRYVPVRRTAMFIEESIFNGIQWAVFQPNDHRLWASLRTNIDAFMNGLFRAGAFQGETANQAYFVRCALGDTMTQGDIDRGQVIVIVGFAPLKPAEFVIVRIQQKVGQQ